MKLFFYLYSFKGKLCFIINHFQNTKILMQIENENYGIFTLKVSSIHIHQKFLFACICAESRMQIIKNNIN